MAGVKFCKPLSKLTNQELISIVSDLSERALDASIHSSGLRGILIEILPALVKLSEKPKFVVGDIIMNEDGVYPFLLIKNIVWSFYYENWAYDYFGGKSPDLYAAWSEDEVHELATEEKIESEIQRFIRDSEIPPPPVGQKASKENEGEDWADIWNSLQKYRELIKLPRASRVTNKQ